MGNKLENAISIYEHLRVMLREIDIPPIYTDESVSDYLSRLARNEKISPYIITREELEGLVPSVHTKDSWAGRETKLKNLLNKMQSTTPKVLILEALDGSVYERLPKINDICDKIYANRPDYSVALVLSDIIDTSMRDVFQRKLAKDTRDKIIECILNQLPMLNANPTLFYESLTSEITSAKIDDASQSELLELARSITDKYTKIGAREIALTDQLILGKRPDSILGLKIYKSDKEKVGEVQNVVITTSNGGGCHKNIAMSTMAALNDMGIHCAIINESELNSIDPLLKFIGIPFSSLYPVVFQQCGNAECRTILMQINGVLTNEFNSQMRFAQLRNAVNYCEEIMGHISVIYSTQHYAEDLIALPSGAKMVFQVCDYGPIQQLAKLASLTQKIPYSDNIRFLIPSKSCVSSLASEKPIDERIFVESVYPTLILSEEEANAEYEKFLKQNDLLPPQTENLIRCSVVMGGMGCGDLIINYVDMILREAAAKPNTTIELIVACGNNKELKSELEKHYESGVPNNVKLKFFGYVNNKQLIAYNKNAVLLTKPGGGTISECLQNSIQTLVHFDPKHSWEMGNVTEIVESGLGHKIEEDKPLLPQIEDRMKAKKELKVSSRMNFDEFQRDVKTILSELIQPPKSEAFEHLYRSKARHKNRINTLILQLQKCEGKNPKDKSVVEILHLMRDYLKRNYSEAEIKGEFQKLHELIEKYGKLQSVESHLVVKPTTRLRG